MKFYYQRFQDVLQEEFDLRLARNSRYTLRAFARDLNFVPTRMYEIMKGRYGISVAAARDLAKAFDFDQAKTNFFCLLVESKHARTSIRRRRAQEELERLRRPFAFQDLDVDRYLVISDWVHSAILELSDYRSFECRPEWIAQKLKLPVPAAAEALDRLKRLSLLKEENGKWTKAHEFVAISSPHTTSQAIQQAHARVLDKAQIALFTQSVEKREFNSLILGIPKSRLNAAKQELVKFAKNFCVQMQAPGENVDSVYCLGMQFFEITESEE